MFIQGYGDRTMGLWNNIVNGLKKNIQRQNAGSSEEYQNAFNAGNQSIQQTQNLADQYTGNQGYQNTLEQAGKGAGVIANQAVGQGISGARSSGMSKAQAAAMGNQMANQTYANAFQGQQGVAQGMGQNAISAQQGITSAQQGQTAQAQSEKQAVYDRAVQNDPARRAMAAASTITGAFTGNKLGGANG